MTLIGNVEFVEEQEPPGCITCGETVENTFRKVEAYSQLLSKEIKKPFIRDGQNR